MVSNFEKMQKTNDLKYSFEQLNEFYNAKKVRERLKLRVLRYWARKTKAKVYKAIKENTVNKEEEREMNIQAIIFEERRLKREVIRMFVDYVRIKRMEKRMMFRAYKIVCRRYKVIAIRSWIMHKQIYKIQQENKQVIQAMINAWESRRIACIIREWKIIIEQKKDLGKTMELILEKIQMKKGLYELKNYSVIIEQINNKMMMRRWLSFFKLLKEQNLAKKHKIQQVQQYSVQKLKANAFMYFKDGVQFQKKQQLHFQQALIQVLNKQLLRNSLNNIQNYCFQQNLLRDLIYKKYQRILSLSFRRLLLNQKLKFLADPALTKRIKLRIAVSQWKDYALEDKRLVKLYARASKHYNRKLKQRYFKLLKRKVCPKLWVLPKRKINMLSSAFDSWKKWRIQKRVELFKTRKIAQSVVYQMKNRFFSKWFEKTQDKLQLQQQEHHFEMQSSKFRRYKLLKTSMQIMKKYTYLMRVYKYLKQKKLLTEGQKLIKKMKEGFIARKTRKMKQNRGIMIYESQLIKKTILSFKMYQQYKQGQKYRKLKAHHQYCYLLVKKSMISMYKNTIYQKNKRQMIQSATQERQTQATRDIFTKLIQVGMYWATIKSRFGVNPRENRTYYALKYGMRWRAKTLIIKFFRTQINNKATLRQQGNLKTFDNSATQRVRMQLMQTINNQSSQTLGRQLNRPGSSIASSSPLRLNQAQISNQPISQQQQTNILRRQGSSSYLAQQQNQSRLKEIEQEILIFKNKKNLLKELESQYRIQQQISNQNGQNYQLLEMMKNKYMTLRKEITDMQPRIKILLEEISRLKGQQLVAGATGFNNTLQFMGNNANNINQQNQTFNQTFLSQNDPSFMLSKSIVTSFMQ